MSIIVSECTYCMYCGNEENPQELTCKAFPDGIPNEYIWGFVDVHEIEECGNGYKYDDYLKGK